MFSIFHSIPQNKANVSQYRFGLEARDQLNDTSTLTMRLTTTNYGGAMGSYLKGINTPYNSIAGQSAPTLYLDQLNIRSKFDNTTITVGTQPIFIGGVTGLLVDPTGSPFGAVKVEQKAGEVDLVAQYGLQQKNTVPGRGIANFYIDAFEAKTVQGKFRGGIGVSHWRNSGNLDPIHLDYQIAHGLYGFNRDLELGVEYYNNVGAAYKGSHYTNAWAIYTSIGKPMPLLKKRGDQNLLLLRFGKGRDSVTCLTSIISPAGGDGPLDGRNQLGWIAHYTYCLAPNLMYYIDYAVDSDRDATPAQNRGLHSFKIGLQAKI